MATPAAGDSPPLAESFRSRPMFPPHYRVTLEPGSDPPHACAERLIRSGVWVRDRLGALDPGRVEHVA